MPADRILIVDDEEPIRDFVSAMLTSANFVCSQAASGKEALALLDSGEEYELMLSDLMMPVMDGIALLEASKERFPDMPVVMVTAVTDVSIALNAIRNGAYDYLLKPFEREQLLATVRRALENRRLKLENRAYQTNLEALVTARTEQLRKAVKELEESYDITLEALIYGGVAGMRVLVVALAFALYSAAVDPDEVLRTFRRLSLRSSLTASLATRLVPLVGRDAGHRGAVAALLSRRHAPARQQRHGRRRDGRAHACSAGRDRHHRRRTQRCRDVCAQRHEHRHGECEPGGAGACGFRYRPQ